MMKEVKIEQAKLGSLELVAATIVYVFFTFLLLTDVLPNDQRLFKSAGIPFQFYEDYFFPGLARYTATYAAFLLLNFKVVPKLIIKEKLLINSIALALVYGVLGIIFGVAATYSRFYITAEIKNIDNFYVNSFFVGFLEAFLVMFLFALYYLIKYKGQLIYEKLDAIPAKYRSIVRDCLVTGVVWLGGLVLFIWGDAECGAIIAWCTIIPYGVAYYCYFILVGLPAAYNKKRIFRAFIFRAVIVLAVSIFILFFLLATISCNEDSAIEFALVNAFIQLIITTPVSWIIFKRRRKGSEEINVLQKELGQSNASLDFLRSQINPHFLFNALNTIYATAINENAERTSEAVEKLADMMRFMLHENMQEKTSLMREIDYLNNYIGLQKLRTEHNPALQIQINIEEPAEPVSIAPMLLIPFVENAFKHGISFREPSEIRVSLEMEAAKLMFDVYNTKHEKQDNDPERNKSGIGLINVKDRLQLLYPLKHELVIRETSKEFFIHLTIELS
jgi:sensor histidine kinase YesM